MSQDQSQRQQLHGVRPYIPQDDETGPYAMTSLGSMLSQLPTRHLPKKVMVVILILSAVLLASHVFYLYNMDYQQVPIIPSRPQSKHLETQSINIKRVALNKETIQHKQNKKAQFAGRLPKVYWMYTQNEVEGQHMPTQGLIYSLNDSISKLGYEVRWVNSWNAYDWLTEATIARISKAMQNSKVDQTVHALLKIALLMQNGGILINQLDIAVLGDSLQWLQDLFNAAPSKQFGCDPTKSYIYLITGPDSRYGLRYQDPFVTAVPGSLLLKQTFDVALDFISEAKFPYNINLNVVQKNTDLGVPFIVNLFEEAINVVVYRYKAEFKLKGQDHICKKYGIQSTEKSRVVTFQEVKADKRVEIMLTDNPQQQFNEEFQHEVNIVRGISSSIIMVTFSDLIDNVVNDRTHPIQPYKPGSMLHRILNAPNNKQVFLTVPPPRKVQLCIIIMKELAPHEIIEASKAFQSQTYQKWKQIIFVKNLKGLPKLEYDRFIFVESRSNLVRNIEIAATKYCQKQSYAVLLHPGQQFNSVNALEQIAKATTPRDIVGAWLSLETQTSTKIPREDYIKFHRGRDAIVNPKMMQLESILNHMRVFSVESFRYIPQFDLRNIHGEYFTDRLIFLMTLLEMIRTEINEAPYFYVIKQNAHLWNVPRRAVVINQNIVIKGVAWQQVDRSQMARTRVRLECEEVQETIHNLLKWKIPFRKALAFNHGDEFIPVDKQTGPEIIPKVIHQVWLGTSDLPPAKQYFYRKTKKMYPTYEVKLWRQENITKQNFPLTYDVITNLIAFNKKSPYNKLATATDIIRHELLYHQGGFWKDAGMNLLRPIFDKFTRYKIAIAVDKTFRYRWLQGMCFFANAPKIQNMWRITNYRNINRMRLYDSYASSIAGPIDFRQFIVGQQEYHSDILCMPYQTFYPAQVTQHPQKDLCTCRLQQLDSQFVISQNGWYLLANCSQQYPYSYAVEHNRFGDSWARRRQT